MIRVVEVTQHYGVRPVLKQVSLEIADGELVVIVGPNGMGKTTLLNVLGGVLSPQSGYVEIDGRRRREIVEFEIAIRRKGVAVFSQENTRFSSLLISCRSLENRPRSLENVPNG